MRPSGRDASRTLSAAAELKAHGSRGSEVRRWALSMRGIPTVVSSSIDDVQQQSAGFEFHWNHPRLTRTHRRSSLQPHKHLLVDGTRLTHRSGFSRFKSSVACYSNSAARPRPISRSRYSFDPTRIIAQGKANAVANPYECRRCALFPCGRRSETAFILKGELQRLFNLSLAPTADVHIPTQASCSPLSGLLGLLGARRHS